MLRLVSIVQVMDVWLMVQHRDVATILMFTGESPGAASRILPLMLLVQGPLDD